MSMKQLIGAAVAAICAGAAFAKDVDVRAFGAKGVRFDGCTFEEE